MKPNRTEASNKRLSLTGIALIATSIFIANFQTKLNPIEASFVCFFNQHHVPQLDALINFFSDLSTPLLICVAVLSLLVGHFKKVEQQKQFGIFLSIAFAINALSTTLLKHAVARVRPFNVNEWIVKLGSGGSFSFPSGHSADAILLGLAILHFYTEKSIRFAAIAWMIFIPFTRVYLGVHYPSDVLGSCLIAMCSLQGSQFYFNRKKTQSK